MEDITKIKERLSSHLEGGEAFMPIDKVLEKIEFQDLEKRSGNLPYSFYEMFYHIQFAQRDIIDYCTKEEYIKHNWPDDYWPAEKGPASREEWEDLKNQFLKDREKLSQILLDPSTKLVSPVREGVDHSMLREVMLVIEHNAYHTGQLVVIYRLLNKNNSL